jgi:hypothetical protein
MTLARASLFFSAVCLSTLCARPLLGQCGGWLPGTGYLGTENQIFGAVTWDPDGAGPKGELLVLTGEFIAAGAEPTKYLTAFDGNRFIPLDAGFFNAKMRALLVHENQLYAAGWTAQNGNRPAVFRWTGATWEQLGGLFTEDGTIEDLVVFEGDIIAAGDFDDVGGVPARRVARWNGAAWAPVGEGIGGAGDFTNPLVRDMEVFQGNLYAAGEFYSTGNDVLVESIAKWDGSSWSPLVSVPNPAAGGGIIYSLSSDSQRLYMGGQFATRGGQSMSNVAAWDGTAYAALGTGVSGAAYDVKSLPDGDLVVAGDCYRAGGLAVRSIARWSPQNASWSALGTGVYGAVLAAVQYNGEVYAGGRFTGTGTPGPAGRPMSFLGKWNGQAWRPVVDQGVVGRAGNAVNTFGTYNGQLVVGGEFFQYEGVTGNGVVVQDGAGWRALGPGFVNDNASNLKPRIYGLAELNGRLYAGGSFLGVQSGPVTHGVAQWDGTQWLPMGTGGDHNTLDLVAHNGSIYACGFFNSMGGVTGTRGIARWNGTAWQSVGGGLNSYAWCMLSDGTDLYVGGGFTSAGGVPSTYIARWDGAAWRAVGAGFNGTVLSLAKYNGELIAGLDWWTTASGASPMRGIARFNGTQWTGIGDIDGGSETVDSLEVYNGRLYAAGSFGTIAGQPVGNIARWNGVSWDAVGGGTNDHVFALKARSDTLYVGGTTFSRVGADIVSPTLARWRDNAGLFIASQPIDTSAALHGAVQFSVRAAGAAAGATYQWRRGGQPLADGPTTSGATVTGSATPMLVVSGVGGLDAGTYDCLITRECAAGIVSDGVQLTVVGSCPADLGATGGVAGQDGILDNNDFVVFIDYFFGNDPRADVGQTGGLPGQDGQFNNNDFVVFVDQFFAGCP